MSALALARRSFMLLPTVLALASCGFHPLYGSAAGEDDVRPDLAAIDITVPHGRLGQSLKVELTDDLNPSQLSVPINYDLAISLGRTAKALAIQLNTVITRYDLIVDAVFALSRRSDGTVIYRNRVRRIASYNVSREPYSTQVAEEDAERRAATETARQIGTLLAVFFRDQKTGIAEPAS